MKTRAPFGPIVLMLAAASLAACGGKTPVSSSTTPQTGTPSTEVATGGVYKVGNPYQINGVTYYPAEDYKYDETGIASWYGPGFHAKMTGNGENFDQNEMTAAHRTLPMPSFVRVTNLDNGRTVVLRVNDRGPYAHSRIIDVSRRGAQLLGFETAGTARVRVQILPQESQQIADAMRSQGRTSGDQASKGAGGTFIARASNLPNEPAPQAAPRSTISSEKLEAPAGRSTAPASPPATASLPASSLANRGAVPMPADPTGPSGQVAPKSTRLFIQVAALSNPDNARALSQKLQAYGPTVITPTQIGSQQFHRVRIGPLPSVEEGDRTLENVIQKGGFPDARLIVD
ncbi:septal ring lytic transglycosylase RlpA family protein [Lacibacterium aquatile]|uniref:Endolytic peptidoglycan transglycosylase RlpA n=1 Tax=Lacibacterium aquatile TaxID=1168082 RepID=A0ABW5DRR4_9PROT